MCRKDNPVISLVSILLGGSAENSAIESKEAGEYLIIQGEEGNHIYLIEEGEVELFINDKLIQVFPAPVVAGEMCLLFGRSVATVKTRTKIFYRKVHHQKLLCGELKILRELAERRNRSNLELRRYSQN